ncbi:MAG: hypothetical protein K2N37_05245 [Lachnospiraceae bacterium]|nr:hypothetical protein [Lachnospiraceae bacterium]
MWKKGRTFAACILATAWWSVFYPELCFTQETCEVISDDRTQTEEIDVSEIWRSSGEELVISSRLLEWCDKKLFAAKDREADAARLSSKE